MRALRPILGLGLLLAAAPAGADVRVDSVRFDPALPSSSDTVTVQISGATTLSGIAVVCAVLPPHLDGPRTIRIQLAGILSGDPTTPPCQPAAGPFSATLRLPPLAPGSYRVTVEVLGGSVPGLAANLLLATSALTVRQPETLLIFLGLEVSLIRNPGTPAAQQAVGVQLSESVAFFWFDDPGNPELLVKVLDGRPVNGHFWIFVTSLTDQAFSLRVGDVDTGIKTYSSPAGHNQNFIDLEF